MNINELYQEVRKLNSDIQRIVSSSEIDYYDDMSGVDYNKTNPEEVFLFDELYRIMEKLEEVTHTIKYLEKPIKADGTLHKNANGRYEVQEIELSSGCGLEYLACDEYHEIYCEDTDEYKKVPYWKASRIEHDGKGYYIVGADYDDLENVRVRIRK